MRKLPENDASYTVHGMVLVPMRDDVTTLDVLAGDMSVTDESNWLATCLCGWYAFEFTDDVRQAVVDWQTHTNEEK